MNKLDYLLEKEGLEFYGFIGLIENVNLVNALLTPFKIILTFYIILELFLPFEKAEDKELLHKKFEQFMIQLRIYRLNCMKQPLKSLCLNLMTTYIMRTFYMTV